MLQSRRWPLIAIPTVLLLAGGALRLGRLEAWLLRPGTIEVDRRLLAGLTALVWLRIAVALTAARAGRAPRAPARPGRSSRGATGLAVTALAPRGIVHVDHEAWSAESDGDPIEAGEPVEVLERRGLQLRVRRRPGYSPFGWAVSAKADRARARLRSIAR